MVVIVVVVVVVEAVRVLLHLIDDAGHSRLKSSSVCLSIYLSTFLLACVQLMNIFSPIFLSACASEHVPLEFPVLRQF